MGHVDPTLVLSQFLGTLPTFIAVILAWMQNNKRIDDVGRRIDDVGRRIDDVRGEMKDFIRSESALVRAEMRRVEEVMDARLKHLEQAE